MEQWEIDLRNKLSKEVSDGLFNIGTDTPCLTGKEGYINFLVEIERLCKMNTNLNTFSSNG